MMRPTGEMQDTIRLVNADFTFLQQDLCWDYSSPDTYLEILLEVNLNFQVRLTIILANGIFPSRIYQEVRCCHLMAISILSYNILLHLICKSLLNISLSFSFFLKTIFGVQ